MQDQAQKVSYMARRDAACLWKEQLQLQSPGPMTCCVYLLYSRQAIDAFLMTIASHHRMLGMTTKRRSIQLLLQLVTKSQGNAQQLLSLGSVCQDLFENVLRQCSDFTTQVTPFRLQLCALSPTDHKSVNPPAALRLIMGDSAVKKMPRSFCSQPLIMSYRPT